LEQNKEEAWLPADVNKAAFAKSTPLALLNKRKRKTSLVRDRNQKSRVPLLTKEPHTI
jgi:hypothetical protein